MFLTLPRDEGVAKEDKITSSGTAMIGISRPASIRIGLEKQRRAWRKMESSRESAFEVADAPKYCSIMSGA